MHDCELVACIGLCNIIFIVRLLDKQQHNRYTMSFSNSSASPTGPPLPPNRNHIDHSRRSVPAPPPPPSADRNAAPHLRMSTIPVQPAYQSVDVDIPEPPQTEAGKWTFHSQREFPPPPPFEKRLRRYPSGAETGCRTSSKSNLTDWIVTDDLDISLLRYPCRLVALTSIRRITLSTRYCLKSVHRDYRHNTQLFCFLWMPTSKIYMNKLSVALKWRAGASENGLVMKWVRWYP